MATTTLGMRCERHALTLPSLGAEASSQHLPLAVQGRTERLSVKEIHGVGTRWLALTPGPSPVQRERGTRATHRSVLMRQKLRELIYSVRP